MAVPVRTALLTPWIVAVLLAGCGDGPQAGGSPPTSSSTPAVTGGGAFRLVEVAAGFDAPLYVTHAGDGSGRLFVVEQAGRVLVVEGGDVGADPFLDLTDRVGSQGSEQGLLGLAFHPGFENNGVAIVSYTNQAGDSVLSRVRSLPDGSRIDPASEDILLQVDQPFANHNGGHVLYGPDGYLYFGLGDGGAANDPFGNGQNRLALLGKLLRLDVGAEGPYTVPADNPFVGDASARPEIWDMGLRNPWRFHFDSVAGDLWIGDVGQDMYEEINREPAGEGGRNYGWSLFEGNHHSPGLVPVAAPVPGFTFPVAEYDHGGGRCSVTGGPVVHDPGLAPLGGAVLYADYCSGTIWSLAPGAAPAVLLEAGFPISSFGEGPAGEVYVVDYGAGRVLRLVGA